MKKIKFISLFLSALTAAALFCGCSDKSNNGNVTYYDSQNEYLTPEQKEQKAKDNAHVVEGKLAEKSTVGSIDITVKKVVHIGDREVDAVNTTKKQMLAIEIEITNNKTEALDVSALRDLEAVVDGKEIVQGLDAYADLMASKTYDGYEVLNTDIEAGNTYSAYTCIAVEQNWKNIKLTYTPYSKKDISFDEVYVNFTPDIVEKL